MTSNSDATMWGLFLLLFGFLGGCVPNRAAPVECAVSRCGSAYVAREGGYLVFQGTIDAEAASRFVAQLRPDDKVLISSTGGDRRAAMLMGRSVLQRRVTVEVNTECSAACALYVFAPASSKSVNDGGLVLFSDPAVTWRNTLRARPDLFNTETAQAIESYAEAEGALYREAGIDPALLDCIAALQGVDLSALLPPRVPRDADKRSRWKGPRAADYVAISQDSLQYFGVKGITGYFLPVQAAARQALARLEGAKFAWLDQPEQQCRK